MVDYVTTSGVYIAFNIDQLLIYSILYAANQILYCSAISLQDRTRDNALRSSALSSDAHSLPLASYHLTVACWAHQRLLSSVSISAFSMNQSSSEASDWSGRSMGRLYVRFTSVLEVAYGMTRHGLNSPRLLICYFVSLFGSMDSARDPMILTTKPLNCNNGRLSCGLFVSQR